MKRNILSIIFLPITLPLIFLGIIYQAGSFFFKGGRTVGKQIGDAINEWIGDGK